MTRYVVLTFPSMDEADAFRETYESLLSSYSCDDEGTDFNFQTGERSLYAIAHSLEAAEELADAVRLASALLNTNVRVSIGEPFIDSSSSSPIS